MNSLLPRPETSPYGALMLGGLAVSFWFWTRLARRDSRLTVIYLGGLGGAFLGAKLLYLLAEGWLHFGDPDVLTHLLVGKSILGAFLGGYAGVEIVKRLVGYKQPTGDWFALIVPAGIIVGRIGCWSHGCCLGEVCQPVWYALGDAAGQPRWPAVPVEIGFNLLALVAILYLRAQGRYHGQWFHLYLMAYGLFRFAHEFLRATPAILGSFSGYQFASLGVAALGAIGYRLRANQSSKGSVFTRCLNLNGQLGRSGRNG